MRLLPSQTDETSLLGFAEDACAMLIKHDYLGLASQFGYALAYDRVPSAAIEADFLSAVSSPYKTNAQQVIAIKYFTPNDTGLLAVVECTVSFAEGAAVLLELIVTRNGEDLNITLEDISGLLK